MRGRIQYVFFYFLAGTVLMSAQTHVSEPAMNLGDTSFLDGIAGPGFCVEQIGDVSHSGRVVNDQGNTAPGAGAVNSISGLTHFAWISRERILGGWYGAEILGAEAHVNVGTQGSAGGWGDLTVSPILIQWKEQTLARMPIAQRLDLDFDLPTGSYTRGSAVNLSGHAVTVHPYYVVTAFPQKRVETSLRFHYLWNGTNNAPPIATSARSTQAGQAIHFNATVGFEIHKAVWIGPNGYYLKQITSPKINGLSVGNSPEQVGAIGPGIVWNPGRWFFFANAYHELGARNRPEGDKLVLRVERIF